MARPNVFDPVFDEEVTRYEESGFRARRSRVGYQAGSERLGVSLWELGSGPPGPFHYHFGNEELLAVLEGRPTLRAPAGTRELVEGEFVAFPRGPNGAHSVGNQTDNDVRVLFFSEMRGPDVIVYPEQRVLGAVEAMTSPERGGMATWLRTDNAVEHHEPEAPDPALAPAAEPTGASILDPDMESVDEPPGYVARGAQIAEQAGAEHLGATIYELSPGNSICPYHWHAANEELLIVLAGTPMLRTPDGERGLDEGEVVAFPTGESGAHKVANRSDRPVRVLMVSELNAPEVAVYPDSGKVMARQQAPGTPATGIRAIFRLDDGVDYWDGELERGTAP
jgi:uncharacterized cupin superfamily protein